MISLLRFESATVAILGLTAVLGPLLLAGTPAWARFGIEAAMATASVLWAVAQGRRWAAVIAAVAITAPFLCQTVTLPRPVLETLAPLPARAWAVADKETGGGRNSISVDPHETAVAAQRAFLGLATITVVTSLGRNRRHRSWLVAAMTTSALLMWALGVALPTPREKGRTLLGSIDLAGPIDFWLTPLKHPIETAGFAYQTWVAASGQRYQTCDWGIGDGFGSYVVSNHFAGGLTLTLPLAIAAWCSLTRGRLPSWVRLPTAAGAVLAAVWTTAFLADSRAGAASMLLAGLTVLVLCCENRALRLGATAVTAIYVATVGAFLVVFFGGFHGVVDLFPEPARVRVHGLLDDPRALATAVALRMFRGSPLAGTGLSTFGLVFPGVASHATVLYYTHNDYAQLLAETGLLGGGMMAIAAVIFGRRFLRFATSGRRLNRDLDAGPWAALAGIALHTALDWNLHVPANAFLACVVAGLALSSGTSADETASSGDTQILSGSRIAGAIFALACVVALAILGRDAFTGQAMAQMRYAITGARMTEKNLPIPNTWPDLTTAVAAGERAMVWDPANPHLALLIGQAHLHLTATPQSIDSAAAHVTAAETMFRRARINCAAGWGFAQAEPVESP